MRVLWPDSGEGQKAFPQIPSAWNIQYAKVPYFGVAYPEPHRYIHSNLPAHLGIHFLLWCPMYWKLKINKFMSGVILIQRPLSTKLKRKSWPSPTKAKWYAEISLEVFWKLSYNRKHILRKILKIAKYLWRELDPGLKFWYSHVFPTPSSCWVLHLCGGTLGRAGRVQESGIRVESDYSPPC